MDPDLDTFLVTLYTTIDDGYQQVLAPAKPRRRGQQPVMSDSEVLTLLVCAHGLRKSERAMLTHAARYWHAYFPRLLDHSAFNRRARDLAGALTALLQHLAGQLGAAHSAYQTLDGVPVPLARRCRGPRRRLFGTDAAIGRGGSDRDRYYGCQLLVAASAEGAVTGFVLGPANTNERWLAEALLCWRQDATADPCGPAALPPSHHKHGARTGPTGRIWPRCGAGAPFAGPYLADRGFRGAWWAAHWDEDYQAEVRTHATYLDEDAALARRLHASERQVIETVNDHLTFVCGLPYPQAKTWWGLFTRIAAKLAAHNLGLWLNRRFGRPVFALATLFTF